MLEKNFPAVTFIRLCLNKNEKSLRGQIQCAAVTDPQGISKVTIHTVLAAVCRLAVECDHPDKQIRA